MDRRDLDRRDPNRRVSDGRTVDGPDLRHRQTLLLEALLSGLDARESARGASTPMLLYLSELFVKRAREELEELQLAIEGRGPGAARDMTRDGAANGDFA